MKRTAQFPVVIVMRDPAQLSLLERLEAATKKRPLLTDVTNPSHSFVRLGVKP